LKFVIGLIGEDPNDTSSIKNLLEQKYTSVEFKTLIKNMTGSKLDSPKTKKLLKLEFDDLKSKKKNFLIIYMRDSDALHSEKDKIKIRQDWFNDLRNFINDKDGIFLLNIYEIEALILADIENFNKKYKTKIAFENNPMYQKEPKEFLKSKTTKFKESDNPEIFKKLDFETVLNNCPYFKDFIKELDSKIN